MLLHATRILLILFSLGFINTGLANTPTLARWAFTDQIVNSTPANELQIGSMAKKDIYIYTRWEDLAIEFYDVEVFIYDGSNTVVGYSNYGFKPDKATWDSWTRYHFRPNTDEAGEWRFIVMVNKTKVLEESIYIEP